MRTGILTCRYRVHRFKTHYIAQLGGNIKNISLSLGSLSGKALIHSAGKNDKTYQWADDDTTAQCFADAAKAAMDYKKGRWVFINVLDAFKAEDSVRPKMMLQELRGKSTTASTCWSLQKR